MTRLLPLLLCVSAVCTIGCGSDEETPGAADPQDTGAATSDGATVDSTVTDSSATDGSAPADTAPDTASDGSSPSDTNASDGASLDVGDARDASSLGDAPTDAFATYAFTVVVEGQGTVTGSGAIDCGSNCSISVPAGTGLTLTAKPALGWYFGGWEQACSVSNIKRRCAITQGAAASTAKAVFKPIVNNLIFASSAKYAGNLGGRDGANLKCNTLAKAVGLPETFKALIATSDVSPSAVLGSGKGFVRLDGAPVVLSVADAQAFKIRNHVRYDETGTIIDADDGVWTGSAPPLITVNGNCQNWAVGTGADTVHVGSAFGGPKNWIYHMQETSCAAAHRLYCVMTDKTVDLVPEMTPGKLVFRSAGGIDGAVSQAAASAQCAAEATTAGITGKTFKVYRSTVTTPAASLVPATTVLVRPDGTRVGTGADLASGTLLSGIWQAADGTYGFPGDVWTGSPSPSVVGVDDQTCAGWTSNTVDDAGTGYHGIRGMTGYANGRFFHDTSVGISTCNQTSSVYCVEN